MQFSSLARNVGVSSESRFFSFFGLVEIPISLLCQHDLSRRTLESVFFSAEFGRPTDVCERRKGVAAGKILAMDTKTAVSAGHLQPWMCPGQGLGGSTVGRCIAAPVGISGSPGHRDERHYVATSCRGRELCRVSTLAVQASSSEKVDRKGLKATIYDSLETERITVELLPELDFTLEGNFYPKLVKLVARKIKMMFEGERGEERIPDFLKHLGMKLSPHIVAEVMKLQNSMAADRFFVWAGSQPDFEHSAHTYNLKFWNLLKNYGGEPGRSLELALILLGEMVAKGLTPGNLACNVLIDRLCKDRKAGAALRLTRVLQRKGFPDTYTYNSLINGLGKVGLFTDVFALLDEMKQKECVPDVVTYNCIISGLCSFGMFKEVFELVNEEMMQRGCCTPDRVTYNTIIHGLCNAGRWQEALKIFEELPGKEIVPDVVTYNSLIGGLLKCRQLDEARNVYDLMGLRGCELDRITYNILIDGFLDFSQVEEAWKLFYFMGEQGCGPDEVTYNILIGGLVDNNKKTEALRVFTAMKEAGCKPNAITYKLLGLSDEEEDQRRVSERDMSRESGNDSGSNGFGESKIMEDEMKILHN